MYYVIKPFLNYFEYAILRPTKPKPANQKYINKHSLTSLHFFKNNLKLIKEDYLKKCYLNSLAFSCQIILIILKLLFKNWRESEDFLIFGYLFKDFTIDISKTIADLLKLKLLTRFMNLSFILKFSNIFPCWYANHMIKHLLLLIILSNLLTTSTASSRFFSLCFHCFD